MAKTLAQGRKPGSGRKPGKGKTLREGRKPGSGRRRRVDEETIRKTDSEFKSVVVFHRNEAGVAHGSISTRDLEAVNALRELNTSPSQQRQLLTPIPTPTHSHSCARYANEIELGGSSQFLMEFNKNINQANKHMHSTGISRSIIAEQHSLTGIANIPIIVQPHPNKVVAHSDYSDNLKTEHGHDNTMGSANQNISGAAPTEKVLISI